MQIPPLRYGVTKVKGWSENADSSTALLRTDKSYGWGEMRARFAQGIAAEVGARAKACYTKQDVLDGSAVKVWADLAAYEVA
jgi:hypothetical protein